MTDMDRVAVIPTIDRPAELASCIEAISPQVDHIIVVAHVDAKYVKDHNVEIRWLKYDMPNLSYLWNIGILAARSWRDDDQWRVAVLNDDAIAHYNWFEACEDAMEETGAALACSRADIYETVLQTRAVPVPLNARLSGWAFLMRGELELAADERFGWWYGDDDLDWQARTLGGTVVIPGFPVDNTKANSTTHGVLAEQAGKDRAAFIEKWGVAPW